jgi:hypothetical protein
MKDFIELGIAILGLAGIAYKLAKTEEKIFDAIQTLRGDLNVHAKEYEIRKEWVDYMLHGLNEKIDHKANRLFDETKELKQRMKYRQKEDDS